MATATIGARTGIDDYVVAVKSCQMRAGNPTFNYAAKTSMLIGDQGGDKRRSGIMIPITSLPAGWTISSAVLSLYCAWEAAVTDYNIGAHRLLRTFEKGTQDGADRSNDTPYSVCWNEYGGGNAWGTAGAYAASDITASAEATTTITGIGAYFTWDITTLFKNWYDGTWTNQGVLMVNVSEGTTDSVKALLDEEHATAAEKPFITITYTTAGNAPTGGICGPLYGPMGGLV